MKRGFRIFLLGLLLVIDIALLPAVARLVPYVLPVGSSPRWNEWTEAWLRRPIPAAVSLVVPKESQDFEARRLWLILQLLMAAPLIWVLFPNNWLGSSKQEGVPDPHPSGAYGTARWRSPKELKKTLLAMPLKLKEAKLGWVVGLDRETRPTKAFLIPPPPNNALVLVLGSSGSGKTRRLVLPNLFALGQANKIGESNSIILTDPKGELYSYTAAYFRDLGYKVVTLNLLDPQRSDRYDPITAICEAFDQGDYSAASEAAWDVAHSFATVETGANTKEDPFWEKASESVIAAVVLYVAKRGPHGQRTMESVYRMITELGKDGGHGLDDIFEAVKDYADPARLAYGVTALSEDKTRAGILTTAAVNLRLFADPVVARMTAASDYSLSEIGERPTVIYLLLPDDKSSRNAVAAMYLSQTYTALSRLANSSRGGRLPVPVFWVLDEFANIGKFKDFDKMITVMRGRNMAAMIVLQALAQLQARYGKELASVITANCDTWLYLRTNDQQTAEELSKKLGKYTIRTITGSASARRTRDLSTSQSEHLTGRSLLTPDEIIKWPMGKVLIMQAGYDPAKLSLADITQWPVQFVEGGPPPLRQDPPRPQVWIPKPGEEMTSQNKAEPAPEPRRTVSHLLIDDSDTGG